MMMAPVVQQPAPPSSAAPPAVDILPVMHFRAGAVRSVCCIDESSGEQSSSSRPKRHSHFVQLAIKLVDAPPVDVMAIASSPPPSFVTVTKNNDNMNNNNGTMNNDSSTTTTRQRTRSISRRRASFSGGASSTSPPPRRKNSASPTSIPDLLDRSSRSSKRNNRRGDNNSSEEEENNIASPTSSPQQKTIKRRSGPNSSNTNFSSPRTFSVRNLRRTMSFRVGGGTSSPTSTGKSFHALGSDDEGGDFLTDGWMSHDSILERRSRDHTTLAPKPRRRSSSVGRQVRASAAPLTTNNHSNLFGGNDPTFIPSRREAAY